MTVVYLVEKNKMKYCDYYNKHYAGQCGTSVKVKHFRKWYVFVFCFFCVRRDGLKILESD